MGGVVVMSGCGMPLSLVAVVARIPSSSFSYVIISPCRTETSSSITAFSLFCAAAAAVDEKTGRDLIVRETRRNAMIDYTTQRQ